MVGKTYYSVTPPQHPSTAKTRRRLTCKRFHDKLIVKKARISKRSSGGKKQKTPKKVYYKQ
jgi:hypothetical protein